MVLQHTKTKRTTETAPIKWTEALKLLAVMRGTKQSNTRLMFAVGFYSGLRIGDILRLRWQDLTGDRFTITEQKTGKTRTVQINPELSGIVSETLEAMKRQPKPGALIFTHQRIDGNQAKPISVTAANKRIRTTFERYDVTVQNPSSHTLRKTFGRRVYEANGKTEAALVLLSKIFNHRDISTTRRYIGLTAEAIAEAYLCL